MTTRFVQNNRGFTFYEFAVVAAVFSLLAGMLLIRALFYQEEAERVAVQQMVGTLRTALQLRVQQVRINGGAGNLWRLSEENPLELLSRKPDNYLGEFYAPELEKMPAGNWVFDRRDKTLIYLLNHHKNLYSEASKFLKFKVELVQLPRQAAGLEKRPAEVSKGVMLVQLNEQASAGPN